MTLRVVHLINYDVGIRIHLGNYLRYLRTQGYDVQIVCSPGRYLRGDTVTEDGIFVKAIPFAPRYTPLFDLWTLARLVRHFRRERFDIVHTHTIKPGFLGRIAARLSRVPLVLHTVHGFRIWEGMPRWEYRLTVWVERIGAGLSDLLLSQNREDIEWAVRERVCPPEKIEYLGNGIDLARFNPDRVDSERVAALRRRLGAPPARSLVGMIGRFVAVKGYREYMAAARLLLDAGLPVRFVAAGPTQPEKAEGLSPDALVAEHGLEGRMTYLGVWEGMPTLLAALDVVVLASYSEGIPRVLMEAAAMGRPVVATDVRGTREVVVDGRTGYLVPPKDAPALAEGIRRVLEDPEGAREMGQAARRHALAHFDERAFFRRTDAVYRRLVARRLSPDRLKGLKPLEES